MKISISHKHKANALQRLRFAAAVAALCIPIALRAQTPQTLRLSLAEAQQYAIEHNYTMQNASLDSITADLNRWKAWASMLPQVRFGFDYQNMCGYTMNMGGFSIPMDPNGTLSVNASVAVTGAQIVNVMMQNIATQMTDITRHQTEQSTRANVKNIYVSILVMEQTVGLLDSSLANLERLSATSQASVNVGAAEQVDADKLRVQVATMRNSIASTRRSLQMLRNSMLLQLGADVNAQLELTTPVDDILNVQEAAKLVLQPFNIEQNYNYQLLEQNEKLSEKQVLMAWMEYMPTLSAYYQYSEKKYFGDEGMNMTPPNMVGASISIPLFQSGSRIASVRSAKIAHQETLNNKRQAEDGLRVQFNQLCYDLTTALESYQIQRENIDVTKRVFDNLTEKYKFGRASSLEVTNASTDIISAQSNYIQAVMSVIAAQIELEKLLNNDNQ
ncbi:MAG: TolC family protein [Bacteroidales bacterium]|jgi:outer membrane protein TolC|nr:TolC family protein [Bacteroidales bacterium]